MLVVVVVVEEVDVESEDDVVVVVVEEVDEDVDVLEHAQICSLHVWSQPLFSVLSRVWFWFRLQLAVLSCARRQTRPWFAQ